MSLGNSRYISQWRSHKMHHSGGGEGVQPRTVERSSPSPPTLVYISDALMRVPKCSRQNFINVFRDQYIR